MSETNERVYFHAGDLVRVKQDIPHRPIMVVERVIKTDDLKTGQRYFAGVKCFWFTPEGLLVSYIFSTKDLEIC